MNITITGGSGFIGSSLVEVLRKKHVITIFDVNKTQFNDVTFVQGDIIDPKSTDAAIRNSDVVIHLAAALGVINTEQNPIETLSKKQIEEFKNKEQYILTVTENGYGFGSLLLKALGITYGVDPIEHDLLWERFLGFDTKKFVREQDFV